MYRTVVTLCTAQCPLYVPTVVTICTVNWSLYIPYCAHYTHLSFVVVCNELWSQYIYRNVVSLIWGCRTRLYRETECVGLTVNFIKSSKKLECPPSEGLWRWNIVHYLRKDFVTLSVVSYRSTDAVFEVTQKFVNNLVSNLITFILFSPCSVND
jgi:hypothetical protein